MGETKTMQDLQKATKNSTFLLSGKIISKVFTFLFLIVIGRILGDANYGKFCFAISFTMMFAIFTDFGLRMLTIKELSVQKEASIYIGNILILKGILIILLAIALYGVSMLLHYDKETLKVIYIVGASIFIHSFSFWISSIFIAYQRANLEAIILIFESFSITVLGILVVLKGYGIIGLSIAYLIANTLSLLLTLLLGKAKIPKPVIKINFYSLLNLLKTAVPLGLLAIFSVFYQKSDTVMLGLMTTDAVVGQYNAAYRILEAIFFIPESYTIVLLPILSLYCEQHKTKELLATYKTSFKFLLILSMGISMGLTILANNIIPMIYGKDFAPAIKGLQVLCWTLPFSFINNLVGTILIAKGKGIIPAKAMGLGALFNIILNAILIPKFSFIGASVATIITEMFSFTIQFTALTKVLGVVPELKDSIVKPLLATIIILFVLFLPHNTNFFIKIIIIPTGYLFLLFLLKAFSKKDIKTFRQFFKKSSIQ
ncbi:MAG: flippase [bacterium]|nr:flippase [bacterium]